MKKDLYSSLVNEDWKKVKNNILYNFSEKKCLFSENARLELHNDVFKKVLLVSLINNFRGFMYLMEDRREIT